MSRVALLMGVSRYATGLNPLPGVPKDVEVLKRVLKQPRFGFESVQCLCDRPRQAMQEAIEPFFQQRASDDQVIFLFCGYILQDADGAFHFATPSTEWEAEGAIVKAQTIPASAIHEAMNSSLAKQQVLILDYSQPVRDPSAVAEPSTVAAQLGGAGRVILSTSNVIRSWSTPTTLDVWTYTRYLAEGIESGVADTDDDGILTAADVHRYATQKLQMAAPALKPQLYGSEEAQRPLLEVPTHDPQVHYRKVLETAVITAHAAGSSVLEPRSLLTDMRQSLGISLQTAAALEVEVLRPVREYQQRLAFYQEGVTASARSPDVLSQSRETLKQLQHALYLNDRDVAMLTIAPSVLEKQRQRMDDRGTLAQYQQVLLLAMQRQYPLQEGDRSILHRLQQTLQLGDDDVKTLEAEMITEAEQFTAAASSPPPQATGVTDTPSDTIASQTSNAGSPVENTSSPLPDSQPRESSSTAPSDDSRAKEVILQQLFNITEAGSLQTSNGAQSSASARTVDRFSPSDNASIPSIPVTLSAQDESLPVLPHVKPNPMDRIRRSTSNSQALLIPALLLAAIIGLAVAILPSTSRPNWFKFGQTPADPAAAQRLNSEGLKKTQAGYNKEAIDDYTQAIEKNPNDATAYINRGVAYHRLGNPGDAIKDYEQALKLNPKSALLYNNLSYAYYDRQNYDKALESGNQAVALNGNLAEAHINLANARAKKGDNDGALRDYVQALTLKSPAPIRAGAYNNRGNVQLALNKTSEAIDDYNRAIRLNRDYADAYYNLGLAQQALGNRALAIRNLQMAATLYQTQNKEALQKEATDRANALKQGNS